MARADAPSSKRDELARNEAAEPNLEQPGLESEEREQPQPEDSGNEHPELDDSPLEESARKKLGVERWDRPLIFRETAEAATDVRLPYWTILVLSGAIATLGLALNNAAVVIGAMLIAPLLGPTMGLGLALAMGDVRLASQTGIAILVSTVAVVAAAGVLTAALPFQTFTSEITARTRPTTLDLAIAVFSGVAGAVVSVTRRKGLSAAIPGVAVAVALIPPLAVAGFSAGAGFRWSFIWGSMLLYGANLAGIVFSGTLVFLLIGMHRPDVVAAARKWHQSAEPTRLAAWSNRIRWIPSLGAIRTPRARVAIVLSFVVALGIPLTITLGEIVRETRVQRAVSQASEIFEIEGRSSILSIQPVVGERESQVLLRVATTEWFGDEAHETFERTASSRAGEPVRLVLEQIPTSSGDLEQLADLFPPRRREAEPRRPPDLNTLIAPARERVRDAAVALTVPDGSRILGFEYLIGSEVRRELVIGYMARRPFAEETRQLLTNQLQLAVAAPTIPVRWDFVASDTVALSGTAADSTHLRYLVNRMDRYDGIHLAILADTSQGSAAADSTVERLRRLGIWPTRLEIRHEPETGLRIFPVPAEF